ncbi:MAG: cupin domain-containing protein [Bosea sp.]|uniref:helix-turn-helix domain-containing protein n=1 Tax=Bosea sp. (in: a-proteobacteria) TaxID=1871050 RepID=UPI001AD221C9|nr:cupin domain-containing protein [Bosea sp. (in: a-proteobacteria)]MBN9451563.1 cupin domain-containing protein [Bosea sp. (in: a-proteobacteria)]
MATMDARIPTNKATGALKTSQSQARVARLPATSFTPVGTETATLNVGARIRALRRDRKWTLEAAAKHFDIGRSTLAKIETSQMSPTIGLLQKIAHGFEVDLIDLLQTKSAPAATGRFTITPAGMGERHETPQHFHELLCSGLANKRMLPFRSRIKAQRERKLPPFYRHEGEELIFVLEGSVILHSEHYAPTELGPGDAAYIDAHMGHCFVTKGDEEATVLFVIAE